VLIDERSAERREEEMLYEGGVEAFVRYLDRSKTPLIQTPVAVTGERDGITVDVALWWNDGYHENVLCFTNNIPQKDGGTHLAGFRGALTRAVNAYAEARGIAKKEKVSLRRRRPRGADLRAVRQGARPEILQPDQGEAGLLRSPPGVESLVYEKLAEWFEENPADARPSSARSSRPRWPARPPARPAS
jgi:DNA gyrase subunit B